MESLQPEDVLYPYSDGEPMGESDVHVTLLLWLIHALRTRFADRDDVQVGGNMFLYYEKGNPKRVLCPDVYIAFGVARRRRKSWKTWEEGGVFPQVIVELVSPSSWVDDMGAKKGAYELLGVKEYFLIDPLGEMGGPKLRGFRRGAEGFEPIPRESMLGSLTLRSEVLGLLWREDDEWGGRPVAPETGEVLLFPPEETQARQREAEARRREAEARQREAEARRRAEQEVTRLRAELERLRGEKG